MLSAVSMQRSIDLPSWFPHLSSRLFVGLSDNAQQGSFRQRTRTDSWQHFFTGAYPYQSLHLITLPLQRVDAEAPITWISVRDWTHLLHRVGLLLLAVSIRNSHMGNTRLHAITSHTIYRKEQARVTDS